MKWLEMHTTESKWQDAPLEMSKKLEQFACGGALSEVDAMTASAMIQSLVIALENMIKESESLEPSE